MFLKAIDFALYRVKQLSREWAVAPGQCDEFEVHRTQWTYIIENFWTVQNVLLYLDSVN